MLSNIFDLLLTIIRGYKCIHQEVISKSTLATPQTITVILNSNTKHYYYDSPKSKQLKLNTRHLWQLHIILRKYLAILWLNDWIQWDTRYNNNMTSCQGLCNAKTQLIEKNRCLSLMTSLVMHLNHSFCISHI